MDKHFSDIINTFKRLDESTKNSHGHNKKQQAAIAIAKQGMAEDGMHDAEHHAHGPEFTGYWAGTDSRTPGKKMVGGSAEESIEEEIMREWDTYLAELGANNPAQGSQPQNPQVQAKQQQTLTTNIQKIAQASGKKPPGGVPTVVKGATELLNNQAADPATGKGMSPQSKKFTATVTDEIGPALLDPQASQQIATAINQATRKQNAAVGVK